MTVYTPPLSAADRQILQNRPTSVGELLERRVRETPDAPGFMYPDKTDRWVTKTFAEFRDWVHQVAAGLQAIGVEPGDRVAIMASTRIEWVLADLANNCIGGVTTSIYPNTTSEDVAYIMSNSGSRFVIAENAELAAKVREHAEFNDQVVKIVIMEGRLPGGDERITTWGALEHLGAARLADQPTCVTEAMAKTGPDTLATMIYTSGTTGRAKGVELTHDNWVYEAASMLTIEAIEPSDVHFVWLPMSHVFGKCLIACDLAYGCTTAIDGRIDKIVSNLSAIRPTIMCGAPRIFEKVRAAALTSTPRDGVKGKIARWAFKTGRVAYSYRQSGRKVPRALAMRLAVADKLVFTKLREKMGGRIRFFISGSAKLNPQVHNWFNAAGLPLIEGYGMTESTAISFLNDPRDIRVGTVGTPAPGTSVKIAEDGEILIKGPGVSRGYWNDPAKTAETFADGWLRTGDIGVLDAEGFLTITDRKKDVIKTSGGKYVSPQEVEGTITANIPYVSQAVVVGEGRKYVSALLVLDPDQLFKWAKKRKIEGTYAELTRRPEIHASIEKRLAKANERLEKWETVKRFAILDHELSIDDGEMTPNLKVRRQKVINRYAEVVDSLYDADVPEDEEKA